MAIPSVMADMSTTAASNTPAGSEAPTNADDYLRAIQGILRTTNAKGADIASASTTDIGAATAEFVDVTGTTTITALGTIAAGIVRTVRFTGALTLTYNATSLILPGAANITTAAGDTAIFRSLGSGNWICISYLRASGSAVVFTKLGANIASAATINLSTATGTLVHITGTTTITAVTMTSGQFMELIFDGILTLTHNTTTNNLPGAANITTAANDRAQYWSDGTTVYCTKYTKADGTSVVARVASTSIVGESAFATRAETVTATSTTKAITPDGLAGKIQSGLATGISSTANTTGTINFGFTFASAPKVFTWSQNGSVSSSTLMMVESTTTTGFTYRINNVGNSGNATSHAWLAIL